MTKLLEVRNRIFLIFLLMLGFLPVCMDLTILHVAAPTLSKDFGADGVEILWVIDIYSLITGAMLIPMGTLADRVGSNRLYLFGLVLFALASAFAAFAWSTGVLIFARGMMGVASAIMVPTTMTMVRQLCPRPQQLATAYGFWAAIGSGGAAAGPIVGGFLLTNFFSGSVFLINVVIVLIVLPFLARNLPATEHKTVQKWPISQGALMALGVLLIVFALTQIGQNRFSEPVLVLLAVFGAFLLYLFYRIQLKAENPLLDLELLKIPQILFGTITAFMVLGALGGVEFTIAQELQYVYGYTALGAGFFMFPMLISSCCVSPMSAFFIERFDFGKLMAFCLMTAGVCLFGLGLMEIGLNRIAASLLLAVIGGVLGVGLTVASTALMNSAPPGRAASAASIECLGFELGSGIGVALFGTLLSNFYSRHIILPIGLPEKLGEMASHSISDTFLAASEAASRWKEPLMEAGKDAFTVSHTEVLVSAAIIVAGTGLLMYWKFNEPNRPKRSLSRFNQIELKL